MVSLGLVLVFCIDTSGLCISGTCSMAWANGHSPAQGDLAGSTWCKCVLVLAGQLGSVVVSIGLYDRILFVFLCRGHFALAEVGVVVWFG